MSDFRMPSLGADMEKGILAKWLVSPGSHVNRGDIIADVETDKGTIAVEIWETGDVENILVKQGEEVPVGTVLATIRGAGTASEKAVVEPAVTPKGIVAEGLEQTSKAIKPDQTTEPRRLHISPLARKIAVSLGVDLTKVVGTGPSGAITRGDVETAAQVARGAPPVALTAIANSVISAPAEAADKIRHAITAAMTKSKREIPHYYLQTDINVGKAVAWLSEENRKRAVTERLLPVALVLKAVALALKSYPEFNGFYLDGAFRPEASINLGIAISLRSGGLVAPAIVGAEATSLTDLMHRLQDLIQRGRRGKLRSSEVTSPTVTVTSLGEQGADMVFGVIYPPQVALIGLGRIRERPWAEHGMVGATSVLTVTLSADHRVSDGHRGSRLLMAIDDLLQKPETL